MEQIQLDDIVVEYSIENCRKRVMDHFSLRIDSGRITVVLGKSGCGKTTLLRLLKGLLKPSAGKIIPEQAKIAYVFQEPRLFPWLTVTENISFFQRGKEAPDVRSFIELVHLSGYEHAYPRQLSGGMQSRVSLARALAYDAEYLLLDEPFAALDDFTRTVMQKELLQILRAKAIGAMFVTHSIDEALAIGDDILVMEQGKIISEYHIDGSERDLLDANLIEMKRKIRADIWR